MLRSGFHRLFLTSAVWLSLLIPHAGRVSAQNSVHDSLGTEYRLIPGGRFIQGTSGGEDVLKKAFPLSTTGQYFGNAEDPAHPTWITRPYYLAATEVTVGQFRRFVQATGYRTSAEKQQTDMVGWEPTDEERPLYQSHDFVRDRKFSWQHPGFDQQDDHPVVGVSWADAKAFCEWLSKTDGQQYRLPTEAEWEYACRAGTSTWFSFGDVARGTIQQYANIGNVELEKHRRHSVERQWLLDWANDPEDGFVFTAPVGRFQPNAWGLQDLHGNVWEWCEDLWLDTVYKDYQRPKYNEPCRTAVDPVNQDRPQTAASDFHVIRGGSWYNGDIICRSANRTFWDREDAACYLGFRLARDADAEESATAAETWQAEQNAIRTITGSGGRLYSSQGLDLDVRFEGDSFDSAALEALQQLPNLQRLRIAWRKRDTWLTQADINAISQLRELLALEFAGSLNPEVVDLTPLTNLHQLTALKFPRDAALNDSHLKLLADFTTLTDFECFGTSGGLTDAGIRNLSRNSRLARLHVWENQATGEFLEAFAGCPLTSFASTRLYNGTGTLTDQFAARLSEFRELTSLTLNGQQDLTSVTLKAISQLVGLQQLELTDCAGFTDADFEVLQRLQKLKRLDLQNTSAGDQAATAIANIPRIQRVAIGGQNSTLSDEGVAELAKAVSIRELQLRSDLITDTGIAALQQIHLLRNLVLQSEQITGSSLSYLNRLPDLDDLSLISPALTDDVFIHIGRSKSLKKLRLAHRGQRPPAALSDAGLMQMQPAVQLKELWLPRNGTQMTEAAMNELKRLMPETSVIPYTVDGF
ncbi:MAG: SUMF1/EgtB/PvdO family nonheme iron enzyme [Planctomycetaceae bacterium]